MIAAKIWKVQKNLPFFNLQKIRKYVNSLQCDPTLIEVFFSVSAAFAPYQVRPFEFAPTLYRDHPHTFRVRPHQVKFTPRLSHV